MEVAESVFMSNSFATVVDSTGERQITQISTNYIAKFDSGRQTRLARLTCANLLWGRFYDRNIQPRWFIQRCSQANCQWSDRGISCRLPHVQSQLHDGLQVLHF